MVKVVAWRHAGPGYLCPAVQMALWLAAPGSAAWGGCVVRGWLARMSRAARVTVCWMRRYLVAGLFALVIHSRISCLEDGGKRAKFARAA